MQGGVQGDERLHACYSSNHDRVADLIADGQSDKCTDGGADDNGADEQSDKCADVESNLGAIALADCWGRSSPAAHKCADDGANANGRPHDGV